MHQLLLDLIANINALWVPHLFETQVAWETHLQLLCSLFICKLSKQGLSNLCNTFTPQIKGIHKDT